MKNINKSLDKILLIALGTTILWGGTLMGLRYESIDNNFKAYEYATRSQRAIEYGDLPSAREYLKRSKEHKEKAQKWKKIADILDPFH